MYRGETVTWAVLAFLIVVGGLMAAGAVGNVADAALATLGRALDLDAPRHGGR